MCLSCASYNFLVRVGQHAGRTRQRLSAHKLGPCYGTLTTQPVCCRCLGRCFQKRVMPDQPDWAPDSRELAFLQGCGACAMEACQAIAQRRINGIVIGVVGAVEALSDERAAEERAEAEARHAHTLRLPRRPSWSQETTPDQLEEQVCFNFTAEATASGELVIKQAPFCLV
eukprot:scaffold304293_cov14-Tisochrysis_lutea.AAC.1